MAAPYVLPKIFNSWKGLDLRSSDLTRESDHATEVLNLEYRKTGAMTKRKGYKSKTIDNGGCGTFTYLDLDPVTGATIEKLVTVDDSLSFLEKYTLDITYSGSATAYANLALSAVDNLFYLDIFEDNTQIAHLLLGVGVDEAGAKVVSDLLTEINALTDFAASSAGDTTLQAAWLDNVENLILSATAAEIPYYGWTDATLPGTVTAPFAAMTANKTDSEFENVTFSNINNILYIGNPYTTLHKFDGTKLYLAGLPAATAPTLALNGGGVEVPGTPEYILIYTFTDSKGNFLTSVESLPVSILAAGSRVDLTIDNILEGSGFDTDGDLKIEIYRNKSGSTSYFLVDSIVNTPTAATQVYTDLKADVDLGIEFIVPLKTHGLPPAGKYITEFQGLLLITGNNENVNTTAYSDIDSPEYFPIADNQFLIDTQIGDRITGIAPLGNSLFVFKGRSIHQIIGQLSEDVFAVNYYGNAQIGCSAHHTIKEVNGSLIFLSDKGVYSLNQNNQQLEEVSQLIEPLFTAYDRPYMFKRAIGYNWIDKDKYVLFMPVLDENGAATNDSLNFVFDYVRGAWLKWDNINALGGFSVFNRKLWFTENRWSTVSDELQHHTYRFYDTGATTDYADHAESISFSYKSNWEHMGEPSVFKKFIRCKIHSLDATRDDFESDSFTLDLITEIDWVTNTSTFRVLDFGGGSSGWGLEPWGQFPWGNEKLNSVRTKLKQTKCRSLRLILENDNVNENVLISGIEYEVAGAYQAFIKE